MNWTICDRGPRQSARALRDFARFLMSSGRKRAKLPQCDVILFCSSDKASFGPAMAELAARLTRRSLRCGLLSYRNLRIADRDGTIADWQDVNERFYSGASLRQAALDAMHGLIAFFCLLEKVKDKRGALVHLLRRAASVWLELTLSRHRLRECCDFLRETGARLVVVHNEKVPIANELIIASRRLGRSTAYFLCEHPDILTQPVQSDEVWVWNEVITSSMRQVIATEKSEPAPEIHVVGHPESDYVLKKRANDVATLNPMDHWIHNGRVFLFISEYTTNKTWKRGPVTRACVRWLRDAAMDLPDWFFVFKTRPYHHAITLPELEDDSMPDNMAIYREGAGLGDFLASGQVVAAGALGSLGLFAAAMCGIPSFRFNVSGRQMAMHFLDELTVPARSPEELIDGLKAVDRHRTALVKKIEGAPYRGRSLDRMEFLALRRLGVPAGHDKVAA